MAQVTIPAIDYKIKSIQDFKVNVEKDEKGRQEVTSVQIDSQYCEPSQRFWDSLCSRFGFGPSIFRYFTHAEVFARITAAVPNDNIRVAIQTTPSEQEDSKTFKPTLLGVSGPDKNILDCTTLITTLNNLDTRGVEYRSGVIVSRHPPRSDVLFKIGEDDHKPRLTLEAPIDGYGKPSVYLSLLRQACKNGLVAYSKAFHSGINIGDTQIGGTLQRILESYSNEDGFVALRNRIESAQKSWASVNEVVRLAQFIWKLNLNDFKSDMMKEICGNTKPEKDDMRNAVLADLYKRSGDIKEIYGVVQLDAISKKRMRTLPTKATVYTIQNFTTELATHILNPEASRRFQGYIGDLVSQEYDLEGSCEEFPTFEHFMIASNAEKGTPNG